MAKETRSEGTARVTSAVASWFWARGARVIVPEVGLSPVRGLCMPWDARWRVDLVACVPKGRKERVDVIEVKGSREDLRRENLGAGKWILNLRSQGLSPWLAVADTIHERDYADLGAHWGVFRVHDDKVKVVRKPAEMPLVDSISEHKILASVLCLQSLPTLMGLKSAQRASAMSLHVNTPWHRWLVPPPNRRVEGPGNIL